MLLEILFYPGVIIHEAMHFLACLLLGIRVTKVSFGLKTSYVQHVDSNAWKTILIALAPFLLSNFIASIIIYYTLISRPDLILFLILLWVALTIIYHSIPSKKDTENVDKKVSQIYRNLKTKKVLPLIILFISNTLLIIPLKLFTFLINIFNKWAWLRVLLILAVFQIVLLIL